MSKQSFEEFIAKLGEDSALREEARTLARDEGGVPLSALAEFAAGKGYRFSVEDVSSELSDEQLDTVAGGLTWRPLTGLTVYPKVESTLVEFGKIEGSTDYYLKF